MQSSDLAHVKLLHLGELFPKVQPTLDKVAVNTRTSPMISDRRRLQPGNVSDRERSRQVRVPDNSAARHTINSLLTREFARDFEHSNCYFLFFSVDSLCNL